MPHPSNQAASPFRTVLLDRDGVLNEKVPEGEYVCKPGDLRILPGVPGAIARLNRAGVRVLVVSNQRGVALGRCTVEDVERTHEQLQKELAREGAHVDAFFYCPHDKHECQCRKPLPGLYHQAAQRFPDISAETSVMIGDSLPDMQFGSRLGMRTVFIEGAAETAKPGQDRAALLADMQFRSLSDAVDAFFG